jgi:hypothetical protein
MIFINMNLKRIIYETLEDTFSPPTIYYALDWDDNIMRMPTKIFLLDDNGKDVGMSTDDFAIYREKVGKEEFNYEGHNIVGFSPRALVDFQTTGDKKFLEDIERAPLVKVGWEKLRDSINNGVIFAIITARGHSPMTLKKAVAKLINMGRGGLDKEQLIRSLKQFRNVMGLKDLNNSELVRDYLNRCFFVPVSYGSDDAISPEKKKNIANHKFHDYTSGLSYRLQKKAYYGNFINNLGPIESGFVFVSPEIHFLDDDEKNALASKKYSKEKGLDKLRTFLTKSGEEEEIFENKTIKNLKARIKRTIF